jgi:hypothetical protein
MPRQGLAGLALAGAKLAGTGLMTAVRAASLRLVGADQPGGRGDRKQPGDHHHADDGRPAVRPAATAGQPGIVRPRLIVAVGTDPDQPQRLAIARTARGQYRLRPGRAFPDLRCALVRHSVAGGARPGVSLVSAGLMHGSLVRGSLLRGGLGGSGLGLSGPSRGGLVGAGLVHAGLLYAGLLYAGLLYAGLV